VDCGDERWLQGTALLPRVARETAVIVGVGRTAQLAAMLMADADACGSEP
jgi:hypothetical protein